MSQELPPQEPMPYQPQPPSSGGPPDWIPITALILGCVNLISWCIPRCGCPFGIGGIIFGVLGMQSKQRRGFAIAGIIMSGLSMLLTIANAALGAYLRASGKHLLPHF
jgi:hypothetical protein